MPVYLLCCPRLVTEIICLRRIASLNSTDNIIIGIVNDCRMFSTPEKKRKKEVGIVNDCRMFNTPEKKRKKEEKPGVRGGGGSEEWEERKAKNRNLCPAHSCGGLLMK